MNSILNIEVSCFANYNTPDNPKKVNLLSWLQSDKYRPMVERIRAIEDKTLRDELKATLPAITASGAFSYRDKKFLIKHSGFIAIDIDFKGNELIGNFAGLKTHLCNITHVAYCGLSVSGRGYWCLIPIAHPDKHNEHFKALQDSFKKFGITIDKACSDVSRLRGYSYDPDGYFNHKASLFIKFDKPEKNILPVKRFSKFKSYSNDKISVAVKMINNAPDGMKHAELLKASNLIGGYIATGEVDETTAITEMESAIKSRDIDNFDDARRTIIKGIEFGKNRPINSKYQAIQKPVHIVSHQGSFQQPLPNEIIQVNEMEPQIDQPQPIVIEKVPEIPTPGAWDLEIKELKSFFDSTMLPHHPIVLGPGVRIDDVGKNVKSALSLVMANNGKRFALPALERLQKLKTILLEMK